MSWKSASAKHILWGFMPILNIMIGNIQNIKRNKRFVFYFVCVCNTCGFIFPTIASLVLLVRWHTHTHAHTQEAFTIIACMFVLEAEYLMTLKYNDTLRKYIHLFI